MGVEWGGASWAAISGVAQSRTRLKWLSSSRSNLAAVAAAVFHYTMMYHSFFIHSFVNGYLGCFLVLAIVNGAAMNFGLRVSFSVLVSSRYMPRSGVARSYGVFPLHGSLPCCGEWACITQWNYKPCQAGYPRQMGHSREFWQKKKKCDPLEEGMANHPVYLPWEPHEPQRVKRYNTERWVPQVLGRVEENHQ